MSEPRSEFRPVDRARHVILVVDDDPISRYTTTRWLQTAGFQTREAATGQEGLKAADSDVSAMVLDVHLPDIDGFELCRHLRSREGTARLPVLHLSAAYVTDEDKVRGLDAGADAYLTHPVEPGVLVASVQALVRARVAEDSMRHSEAQFKAVYARAPGGIGLLDTDGRFVSANPSLLRSLGRTMNDVLGHPLHAFVPPAQLDAVANFLSVSTTGESRADFPAMRADGSTLQMQWTLLPQVQPGLNMVLAADMTQHALLEDQRLQALERERAARGDAERVSRIKDEFIAVLSHELRTPLTAVSGWTHILRKRPDDAALLQRGLDAIQRNVALQTRLVSDLLDMSSINLGKMRLSLSSVNVAELVRSVAETYQLATAEKDLRVQVSDASGGRAIVGDVGRIQQIVSNLLANAIKFSAKDGEIDISLNAKDEGVEIAVADNGKGISPKFLPRLFDRFSQADAGSNRRHGGLGLGLSIVRHLVESHDGSIVARSAGEGQGATFAVWLPAAGPRVDAQDGAAPGSAESADAEASLADVSLLVVDDDPEICAMLEIILRDRGAEVRIAHDSDTALDLIDVSPPDLLLSDIGMPGRDGYAFIREVRRRGHTPRIPAIALTSYTREQDRAQAMNEGFDAHCAKPIRPLELVQLISHLLRR